VDRGIGFWLGGLMTRHEDMEGSMLRVIIACALLSLAPLRGLTQEVLSGYRPETNVSGPIRSLGGTLGGQYQVWENSFQKYHRGIRFVDTLISSEASIGGLYSGASDLGPSGREAELMDLLPFTETFGYPPLEITVASGAFDPGPKGGSASLAILVNRENPIAKLTMKQLDDIFGEARSGGLNGTVWSPANGRSASDNIRTWGELGLGGEWTNKTIHTYGYAYTGMKWFFQSKVFHGGDTWNPTYREYVETESAMVDRKTPAGQSLTIHQMLADLSNDKYGIGYCPLHYAKGFSQLKTVALAVDDRGPYIEPSRATFQSRTYPLTRSIYIYLNRAPGQPVDLKLREFLRYILSKQGQEDVAVLGRYLPLPAAVVREQLKKLD